MEQVSGGHQLVLTASDLVARPKCPVCRSPRRAHFRDLPYGDSTTRHFRCEVCGLIYMDPVPRQAWYDQLYGEEFWEVKSETDVPSGDVWENRRQWGKGLARAEKYIDILRQAAPGASIKSLLEIGASFGLIGTAVADAYGARAFGVEPNNAARDFASRASGMTMVAKTAQGLDEWKTGVPVDLVIFSHVLENIIDPRNALKAVHRKLKTGGLLLIETPDGETRPSMSIYHPYCYSSTALQALLTECGFAVLQEFRTGRPTSLVLPIYLTIVATAVPTPVSVPERRSPASTAAVKSRHLLYRIFYKSPFGKLDLAMGVKRFSRTDFVERGIQRLKASLKRLHAIKDSA